MIDCLFKATLQLCFIAFLCFWTKHVNSKIYERDFSDIDIFQAVGINHYVLYKGTKVQKLNDMLIDRTSSNDPDTNLDILLEELVSESKVKVPTSYESVYAKRLMLALRTLKGEHLCDYYSYRIITNNYLALGAEAEAMMANEGLRRVDEILFHYIKERIENCSRVYVAKFDQLLASFNAILLNRLDSFLDQILLASNSEPEYGSRSSSEKLRDAFFKAKTMITPIRIYDAMQILAKDDQDAIYVKPVENEKTGLTSLKRDKFGKLFEKYVYNPCNLFRQHFGPDVFEPILFDNKFKNQIPKDRVDIYEALMKYRLCDMVSFKGMLAIIEYQVEKTSAINRDT